MTRRIVELSDAEWEGVDELQNRIANHIEKKFGITVWKYDFIDTIPYAADHDVSWRAQEWVRVEFKLEFQGRKLQLRAWMYRTSCRKNNDRSEAYKNKYHWKLGDRCTYNVIDHFFDDNIALTHNSKGQWLGNG